MPANLSNETMHQSTLVCSANMSWILTMMPASLLIICVLGIILNLFVLVVFCFHKKACTVPEIYLSNLAAADLLLMWCLPFEAVSTANEYIWPFGNAMCKLLSVFFSMNSCCSSGFLVLVSIDRYLALVHPLSHERLRRPICAKLGCLLVWTLGLLLSVHNIIYKKTVQNPTNNATGCAVDESVITTFMLCDVMVTIFNFFIPLCVMCFCTVKIVKVLRNRVIERSNAQKMEHKATTLVLAVLLVFLICWLPFHMTKMLIVFLFSFPLNNCPVYITMEISRLLCIFLAFLNSVLNPLLYVIVGKTFHKKAKAFFRQCINVTMTTSLCSGKLLIRCSKCCEQML
ncbi:B2 bradykinin receptor-like [Parambassis ranga]|uniref:B2 bradykinin receptor-like n=1 Tax=Parambassis ranga TaxID=210632 RepID=A0A6P7JRF5_9TELE|nr:B2 bradykinin receptor-like [Parambassis ranga]